MDGDRIYDVVKELVGEIEPVGETNADNRYFENLETLTGLVEALLTDIYAVVRYEERTEYSMNRAGKFAHNFLVEIKNEF